MESIDKPAIPTDGQIDSKPISSLLQEHLPYDLVLVIWDDIAGSSGWAAESELDIEKVEVRTYGILIRKTKSHLLVASSFYEDEETGERHFSSRDSIPKGAVKKIITLVKKHVHKPKSKAKETT